MKLYLDAKTTATDLTVDYIEVSLTDGTIVSMNWDESCIYRNEPMFNAIYKGVRFNVEPADGRINELQGMQICDVGLYSEMQVPAQFSSRRWNSATVAKGFRLNLLTAIHRRRMKMAYNVDLCLT